MTTVLKNVSDVSINVLLVELEKLPVVISVEKTENHNLNQIVHVNMVNMKLKTDIVLYVQENALLAVDSLSVLNVLISENKFLIAIVQLVGMMMPSVLSVQFVNLNVSLVLNLLKTVPFVSQEESNKYQLVHAHLVLLKS
jgi:hypothetical protein